MQSQKVSEGSITEIYQFCYECNYLANNTFHTSHNWVSFINFPVILSFLEVFTGVQNMFDFVIQNKGKFYPYGETLQKKNCGLEKLLAQLLEIKIYNLNQKFKEGFEKMLTSGNRLTYNHRIVKSIYEQSFHGELSFH